MPTIYKPDNDSADMPAIYEPERTTIVPVRLRSTDRPIDKLCVRPLSPPDTCTVLLPESDNCRADTPAARTRLGRALLPRIRPRCWHYTATRTTLSLVPYYYPTRQ